MFGIVDASRLDSAQHRAGEVLRNEPVRDERQREKRWEEMHSAPTRLQQSQAVLMECAHTRQVLAKHLGEHEVVALQFVADGLA